MYGVCEAWRGVLPGTAPTAHCGQVNKRARYHCHCCREAFIDILLDPYEEDSPFNLLLVLWSREGFPFILGVSCSLSAPIFTNQEKLISCLCLFLLTLTVLNPTPKPDFCCCQVIFFTSVESEIPLFSIKYCKLSAPFCE